MKKKNAPTKPATPDNPKASAELRCGALLDGDPQYQCVMVNPKKPQTLKAVNWTMDIKGTHVRIPSNLLFITEDGSVYIVTNKHGDKATYTSLNSLIETVNKTVIIENFSTDDKQSNAQAQRPGPSNA